MLALCQLKATIHLGNTAPTSGDLLGTGHEIGAVLPWQERPHLTATSSVIAIDLNSTICEIAASARIRRINIQLQPKARQIAR